MADRDNPKTDRPEGKRPAPLRRRTRLVIVALAILAVGLGAWAIWHQLTKPKEIALDLGNNVKMRLVLIPAGKFMMGSPAKEKGRGTDEAQHEVIISKPFYMGVFEVTQEQYEQMMGNNPSAFKGPTNPVECVSWNDAVEFCGKLSKKTGQKVTLPTEAQWEYACRAGTTTAFNTGDDLKKGQASASFPVNPGVWDKFMDWVHKFFPTKVKALGTTAAGIFPPNGFGLYDMHGNVFEWCMDWHGQDYYANSPKTDPQGPATGKYHVLHGGCWVLGTWACRCAYRYRNESDYHDRYIGFRVVVLPGPD